MTELLISKEEYQLLKRKAELFDHYVENEELAPGDLAHIKKALQGPFIKKEEFMKRHPELF